MGKTGIRSRSPQNVSGSKMGCGRGSLPRPFVWPLQAPLQHRPVLAKVSHRSGRLSMAHSLLAPWRRQAPRRILGISWERGALVRTSLNASPSFPSKGILVVSTALGLRSCVLASQALSDLSQDPGPSRELRSRLSCCYSACDPVSFLQW